MKLAIAAALAAGMPDDAQAKRKNQKEKPHEKAAPAHIKHGPEQLRHKGHGMWKIAREQLAKNGTISIDEKTLATAREDWQQYYHQPFEYQQLGHALSRRAEFPDYEAFYKSKGIDPDVFYLGIVETWFNDDAVSKAKAVGSYQFLKQTAMRPDIRLVIPADKKKGTPEIDNRKNFELSSKACATYVASIINGYGKLTPYKGPNPSDNLLLAVSHYNGSFANQYKDKVGPDKVSYAGYVEFIQQRIHDKLISLEKEREYEIEEDDTLASIAHDNGTKVEEIAKLNGIDPKAPLKLGQKLRLPPAISPHSETEYVVPSGGTLGKIAKMFKTTVEELRKLNGLKEKDMLKAGQRLKIPHTTENAAEREALKTNIRMRAIKGLLENLDYALKWQAVRKVAAEYDKTEGPYLTP